MVNGRDERILKMMFVGCTIYSYMVYCSEFSKKTFLNMFRWCFTKTTALCDMIMFTRWRNLQDIIATWSTFRVSQLAFPCWVARLLLVSWPGRDDAGSTSVNEHVPFKKHLMRSIFKVAVNLVRWNHQYYQHCIRTYSNASIPWASQTGPKS